MITFKLKASDVFAPLLLYIWTLSRLYVNSKKNLYTASIPEQTDPWIENIKYT